jgi:hypothetical protein
MPSATTASPRRRNRARHLPSTMRSPSPHARAAAANGLRPAGPASPPPSWRSPASWAKACGTTPSPSGCSSPPCTVKVHLTHLRQARHHHPRRTGRPGPDRQMT